MQTNIFSLIDTLLAMSGTINSYDSLQNELHAIELNQTALDTKIKSLKNDMHPEKYFDATSEIVDRNIEIGINKKQVKLSQEKITLQNQNQELETRKQNLLKEIDYLSTKLKQTNQIINLIENRLAEASDEVTQASYSSLAEVEKNKSDKYELQLTNAKIELDKVNFGLTSATRRLKVIAQKIEVNNERLEEVQHNLADRQSYINVEQQQKDEAELTALKEQMMNFNQQKEAILREPALLVKEIKEAFLIGKKDFAMKYLKELKELISAKPYMDVESTEDLKAELDRLLVAQKELVIAVENKHYDINDMKLFDNRVKVLQHYNELLTTQKETLKQQINQIDTNLVPSLMSEIKELEAIENLINENIKDYHELVNQKPNQTLTESNYLKSSYAQKNNQLRLITDMVQKYETEVSELIECSSRLENTILPKLVNAFQKNKREVEALTKAKMLHSKTKDFIAQENDKKEIIDLETEIKAIQHRLEFDKSPQQIYDEIDMLVSSCTNLSDILLPKIESEKPVSPPKPISTEVTAPTIPDPETALIKNTEFIPESDIEPDNTYDTLIDYLEDNRLDEPKPTSKQQLNDKNDFVFTKLDDANYFNLDDYLRNLNQ